MRNPQRIDEMLELIKAIWQREPDMRFFQLLHLIQSEYSQQNDNIGKVEIDGEKGHKQILFDFFNVEDDKIVEFFKHLQRSSREKNEQEG